MLRCIGKMVFTANHMRHSHRGIVDDHGKVVRGHPVGANNHRIPDDVGVEAHHTTHRLLKDVGDLLPLAAPVVLGTAVLIALRWRMNVMSLPEEEARALGVATGPLRIAIVVAATLTTSASVATSGIIGWVGLVVPHLARSLVGPDFARLLPAAAILGGGYLLLIDTLARTMAQVEIPLGILTAVIGTPFFIWLLASVQKNWS